MWDLYLSFFELIHARNSCWIVVSEHTHHWPANSHPEMPQTSEMKPYENLIKGLLELVLAGESMAEPWGRGECQGLGQTFSPWIILVFLFSHKTAVLNLSNALVSLGKVNKNTDAWVPPWQSVIYVIWWEAGIWGFIKAFPGDPNVLSVLRTNSVDVGMRRWTT